MNSPRTEHTEDFQDGPRDFRDQDHEENKLSIREVFTHD